MTEGTLEFQMRQGMLRELADQAGIAIPTRETTQLVLSCFRVSVSPEEITLAATDMQRTVWASTAAVRADSGGTVYLPGKRLRAILAGAPDGDVTVSVTGRTATVSAGGTSWQMQLPAATSGYPELADPEAAGFCPVPRVPLLNGLKTVRHAVCKEASRPAYAQVSIARAHDGMFAWATDSSQYSRAPVRGFPFETCIPGAMLDDLIRLLGSVQAEEIEAAEAGRQVLFRAGAVTLSCLRMGKEFPDIRREALAPTAGNDAELTVDRDELLAAVRRVAISASAATSAMALVATPGSLAVQARDDDGNRAEEVIKAGWDGSRRLLVVNWRFLVAMVTAHPPATCVFRLGEDRNKIRSLIRLDDPETGIIGIAPQTMPAAVGY